MPIAIKSPFKYTEKNVLGLASSSVIEQKEVEDNDLDKKDENPDNEGRSGEKEKSQEYDDETNADESMGTTLLCL